MFRAAGGVVIAGRGPGAGGAEPRTDVVRLEEAGLTQRRRHERTREVAGLAVDVAIRRVMPDLARGDALPEDLKPLQTPLRRIAGDDRRIDRADRHAAHPVRLDARFVQRLIDAGLIGAERAAALQHQRDPVAAIRPPVGRDGSWLNVACARPWQYPARKRNQGSLAEFRAAVTSV